MHQKRKQTLQAGAGLLTALTLSVGLLAGCNPASFNPGPGAPTAPSVPSAPAEFDTLEGAAALSGAALKNADIKVFNALTGAPAQVVAAGGNVIAAGGGNFAVQGDSLKTDANGNFSLKVAGLTPGSVARVVVSSEGKTLSALVSGDGSSSSYEVQAVTFKLNVNEVSTSLAEIASGMLAVAAGLKVDARTNVVRDLMNDLKGMEGTLAQSFRDNPSEAEKLARAERKDDGTVAAAEQLNSFLETAGLVDQITAAIQKAADTVATQVAARQVEGKVDLAAANFVGTKLTIKIEGNKITIGDKVIDLTPSPINTPADPVVPPLPIEEVPPIEVPQQQNATGPVKIVEDGSFNPSVTVGTTTLSVSQTAGQDDIKEIFGRVKKSDASVTNSWTGSFGSGSVNFVPSAMTDQTFTIAQGGTAPSTRLPAEFGSASVGSAQTKWTGHLALSSSGNAASFTVYEVGDYYVLYTKYLLSDSVTFTGGHTTTVTYSGLTLNTGKTFETVLRSRNNSGVFIRNTVQ